jgi:hypothetical protein
MKKTLAAALLAVAAFFASSASAHDWSYVGAVQPQYQLARGYTSYRPYYGGSYHYTPRHYGRYYRAPSYGWGYGYPSYGYRYSYPAYGYGYGYGRPYTSHYGGYYGRPSAGLYFRF